MELETREKSPAYSTRLTYRVVACRCTTRVVTVVDYRTVRSGIVWSMDGKSGVHSEGLKD